MHKFSWLRVAITLGCLGGVLVAILAPVFASAKAAARGTFCLSNLKDLSRATDLYRSDFDDRLMSASRWTDQLAPLTTEHAFTCLHQEGIRYSYAMEKSLSERIGSDVASPERKPLFFDSRAMIPNAMGGESLLPDLPRHAGVNYILYLDGRVTRQVRSGNGP